MTGIIFLLDLDFAPFVKRYCNILDKIDEKYEIVTWNRMSSKKYKNVISFDKKAELGDSKIKKIFDFFAYSKFLNKVLSEKSYDRVIVLTTLTGFLCFKSIVFKYRNKYIFDIRDYTYEKYFLFRCIEKAIIRNSYFTVISSKGFEQFIPNYEKYIICHNFLPEEIERAEINGNNKPYFSSKDKIIISFIGAVRHLELNKKMLDIFGDDSRFELRFHGYGVSYDALKNYVEEKKYSNVMLTGKYDRSDKDALMKGVSLINGYYDEYNIANKTAVSNKYYDTLIYKIPFWGNPRCFIGEDANQKGIGIAEYLDDSIKDKIYTTLKNFDYDTFSKCCEEELRIVLKEDREFVKKVEKFINGCK